METYPDEFQSKYNDALQDLGPQFDLEAFKLCTDSIFPSIIFWGPKFKCYYNSAFADLIRIDEMVYFGKEADTIFNNDAWRFFRPQVESVIEGHTSLGAENQLIYLFRKGFQEECYIDYSMEPILMGKLFREFFVKLLNQPRKY